MRAKTRTANGMLGSYKYLSMACIVSTSFMTMLLPSGLVNKFDIPINIARAITLLLTTGITYGILDKAHEVWILAHNEMLEKDVYEIQNALKQYGKIEITDIDNVIQLLTEIRDKTNIDQSEQKKD